jgi:hypothetical protein
MKSKWPIEESSEQLDRDATTDHEMNSLVIEDEVEDNDAPQIASIS